MNELKITLTSDLSNEGLAADIRALRMAVCLLATRIPKDNNPYDVCNALKGTEDSSASELANLIKQFLDKAHNQT